ncbi:MAG: hypothetical protein AABW67_01410 [Nanoarchaeota archaeon]|mgnify:CR=1 FL=1
MKIRINKKFIFVILIAILIIILLIFSKLSFYQKDNKTNDENKTGFLNTLYNFLGTFLDMLGISGGENQVGIMGGGTTYSDYLHFYQIRYNSENSAFPVPLPEGRVNFTIGDPYDGIPQYIYVSIAEIHGHEVYLSYPSSPNYVYNEVIILNSSEVDAIFNGKTSVTQDRIQRADIEKLHSQLIVQHPEWYANGIELNYGVLTYANGTVILDSNNKTTNDSSLDFYQNGKTIVLPTRYNNKYLTRLNLNYNNPTVREYAIRFILKKLNQSRNNAVFIDNTPEQETMLFEDGDYRNPALHYISSGDWQEQTRIYVNNSIYIYNEVKKRGNNPQIIKNGLRSQNSYRDYALKILTNGTNFDSIDGMMIENKFWSDEFDALENKWGLNGYINWSIIFGNRGKKILYVASDYDFSDNEAFNIWLFASLIANNNSYFFINQGYDPSMKNFSFYNYSIGQPLTEIYKEGDVFKRKFQGGIIEFNETEAKKNGNIQNIKFIENNYCGNSICDSGETTETCPVDCEYQTFFLDVGSSQDTNTSKSAYLKTGSGISAITQENSITYRALSDLNYLYFYFNTSTLSLAENGVPYKDAILEIGYKDTVDETNCNNYNSYMSYCRPYIEINLNYGNLGWHRLEGFGGIKDNLWKNETIFIENNYWQVLRSIGGNFNFRIYYPNQLNGETSLPIDYIKLTFYNNSEFNRLRELDRINRTFVRKDYIETNTLNKSDFQKNYLIYSRNYLEKIYPNTVPKLNEITNNISTFEIAGNYEPLTFTIYAFENLENLKISVSDLNNGNEKIIKENIRVDKVVSIDKRWQYSYDKYYGTNPWYLDNITSFNIAKNTSQQVWLTIYVPKNTPKGNYLGKIQVTGDNLESSELNLSLEVFDIVLEEPDAIPYLYHSPYIFYKYYSNPKEVAAVDMSAHSLNPILSFFPSVNSSFAINFTKTQDHIFEILRYKELGILPSTALISISDNNANVWFWTQGNSNILIGNSNEFDRVYASILGQYKEFFESYGITPIVSFNDEPGMDKSKRRFANHFNKLAHDAGLKTWVTYYNNVEIPLNFKMYFNCNQTANAGDYAQYEANVNKNSVPEILNWSIYDEFGNRHSGHKLKILVNDNLALDKSQNISYYHGPFNLSVNLSEYSGETVNVKIRMEIASRVDCSNQYYSFGVYPYFGNDSWFNQPWQFTSNHQSYSGEIDQDPYLGPMDTWLDNRVYALSYVTEEQINLTNASGDTFMYYTTYPANQPVILNNRFLNGIYASATGAKGVNVYAYGDWGQFPYDDMSTSYRDRLGTTAGLRSQSRYELILPSWEPRVYDTVVHESLREGIEDSRIIATLKKAIKEHPGEKANEVQEYLNLLFSKPCKDCHHYPTNRYRTVNSTYLSTNPEKYADRSEEILYDLSGNKTNYKFFDNTRKTMIEYIVELNHVTQGPDTNAGSGESSRNITRKTNTTNQTINQEDIINNQEITNENIPEDTPKTITNPENPLPKIKSSQLSKLFVKVNWIYTIIILTSIWILIIVYLIFRNLMRKSNIRKLKIEQENKEKINQARTFISNLRERGYNNDFVRKLFIDQGWPEQVIDRIFWGDEK